MHASGKSRPAAWWAAAGANHRLVGPILVLTLITAGTLVYLMPGGASTGAGGPAPLAEKILGATPSPTAAAPVTPPSGRTTDAPSTRPASSTPTKPAATPTGTPTTIARQTPISIGRPASNYHQPVRVTSVRKPTHPTAKPTTPATKPSTRPTTTPAAKVWHCWDFTWQQDAQKVYVANLSDPWGLDAGIGPHDGDGLACSSLPVDPKRPPSTPVDAYTPPVATAAAKSVLVAPQRDYYGVTEDGLPVAAHQFDRIAKEVGKAPSAVGFFSTWDKPYPAAQVTAAWQRGALPVLTWLSKAANSDNDPRYSLNHIIAGDLDDYLYRFAGSVARTGLPVVIRFDHEMNGNWYPWSAGRTAWNNSPQKYVAAWRHVWSVFDQVGANDDVIWLYSPARVDNLGKTAFSSSVADDYPGDAYVDWVGATVYWRNGTDPTDYRTSFGATVAALRAVTAKPLFFAEIGAVQAAGTTDVSAAKQQWITNTLRGFLADPTVVGFTWFNNVSTTTDGTHDWRFDASSDVLAAFTTQIVDGRFQGGVMPDASG